MSPEPLARYLGKKKGGLTSALGTRGWAPPKTLYMSIPVAYSIAFWEQNLGVEISLSSEKENYNTPAIWEKTLGGNFSPCPS